MSDDTPEMIAAPLVEFARHATYTASWARACQADLDEPDLRDEVDKQRRKAALGEWLVSLKQAIDRTEEFLQRA